MKYFVTLSGRTWEVTVDGAKVTVDGQGGRAELRSIAGTPIRVLVFNGATWQIPMESGGRGVWTVLADGEAVEVEVLDERAAHIRSLIGSGAATSAPLALKAPMPGLVVRVLVEPGQQVKTGASLLVLEAMKMENELKAPAAGVIEAVDTAPGQTVEKAQVLIRFRAGS